MALKQKILGMASLVIPVLALVVFFAMAPPKARAQGGSCPGPPPNEVYAPCGGYIGGCGSGEGACYEPHTAGTFVFCKTQLGYADGPGVCESGGCVYCEYGHF